MKSRLFFPFILPALLTAPLLAVPAPHAGEMTANRVRLEGLQKNPAQLARLRRDARAFLSLTPARREQVLQLDYDLQQEAAPARAQMLKVLERYSEWLERRPGADRQTIDTAKNKMHRVTIIREIRDKEWMLSQPHMISDKWQELTGSARAEFLQKARVEDRQRRQQWEIARRFSTEMAHTKLRPVRFADLDPRDQEGVKEYLMPMLSEEERQLLAKAEGNWPAYPMTLVELADRHPLALPGKHGPVTFNELPAALKSRFNDNKMVGRIFLSTLKHHEGSWPNYATAVARLNKLHMSASANTALPRELWACDYKSLLSPMQEYVNKVLVPALATNKEEQELRNAEGHWPKYPKKIQELVLRHALPPPPWATALYGPPERWDDYRAVKKGAPPQVSAIAPTKGHD